ncbi:hypothetical protein JFL47_02725 [Haemophilus haemoglobinophilus]|nr:hypothetical protein [Canicola haemoglobinophilus]
MVLKYCPIKTKLASNQLKCLHCLTSINQLVIKEGFNGNLIFKDEYVCIDMDQVERVKANDENRVQLNKSMDSAFSLENTTIVLVEYRFNYQNLKNLKSQDLTLKKFFSEQIISKEKYLLHNEVYYVFDSSVIEQAKRRFRNFNPQLPQEYKPIELQDLKSKFFSV